MKKLLTIEEIESIIESEINLVGSSPTPMWGYSRHQVIELLRSLIRKVRDVESINKQRP